MVTHSQIVDPFYILHENMPFRSLKNMLLINISFYFLNILEDTYLSNVLTNLSFMDFLFYVPFFCTAAGVVLRFRQ
jgi:hypothetical protein